jgi:Arc/MetJ-type ribon-helix-helix transcriptional regulator
MTTLSVPVPPKTEEFVKSMVKKGYGANKADVVRKALDFLAEEEAVRAVLEAQREPTIKGGLNELMEKL